MALELIENLQFRNKDIYVKLEYYITKVKGEQMDRYAFSEGCYIKWSFIIKKGNNGLFNHTLTPHFLYTFMCSRCNLGENIKVQREKLGTV